MNIPKLCLRLAVFFCTLTVALFITRLFLIPPRVAVTIQANPQIFSIASEQAVNTDVHLVALERTARKAHLNLTVERASTQTLQPTPDRLWVWTYFFTPDAPGKFWAGAPVEVRAPFARGGRVTLNLTSSCDWCADEDSALPHNFYARVNVSTESAAAARRPVDQLDFHILTAMPVVVEHEKQY